MKDIRVYAVAIGIVLMAMAGMNTMFGAPSHTGDVVSDEITGEMDVVEEEVKTIDPWDVFIEAVIWQESRGNANAIGDNGRAVGVLQIHPIMVREANRIVVMGGGETGKYTYDDRYDVEKSIEIFKIVQDFHNKEHDFDRALQIWNKNHPESYKTNIINKYNVYLNERKREGFAILGSV